MNDGLARKAIDFMLSELEAMLRSGIETRKIGARLNREWTAIINEHPHVWDGLPEDCDDKIVATEENPFADLTADLPAWFTERMMTDCWMFGLLTTSGDIIMIESMTKIVHAADGSLWADVKFHEESGSHGWAEPWEKMGYRVLKHPLHDRRDGTIRMDSIVCAFEMANT